MQRLITLARWLLYGTVLVPLVIDSSVFFPFAFPKLVLFRTLVELSLASTALAVAWALVRGETGPEARPWNPFKASPRLASLGLPSSEEVWKAIKSPLGISLILFLFSFVISMLFSADSYRAFWGDVERGEGVIGILHVVAFGALLLAVFRPRDWNRYLKLTVTVGFVVLLYGVFQYFGVNWVPFARGSSERIDSFLGNAAFLATHTMFVSLFAWFVWRFPEPPADGSRRWTTFSPAAIRAAWRWFSAFVAVLGFVSLFLTGTRGAMLGLGAGIFVVLMLVAFRRVQPASVPGARRIRTAARAAVVALMAFSAIFWVTRHALVWQSVPGLDRLARTAESSVNDGSTQTRLITWRISWQSFLEKPIVGWGPEQYITAYERHYDPAFAYYGETWLDRAHSKAFDLLVAQGVVGTAAYVALLVALGALVWRRHAGTDRAILLGFLVFYVVQNLVLFDQVVSYLTFAVLVGWVARRQGSDVGTPDTQSAMFGLRKSEGLTKSQHSAFLRSRYVFSLFFFLLSLVFFAAVYLVNLLPYAQARAYKESPALGDVEKVIARLRTGMYPVTFAQKDIRGVGIDNIYQDQYFFYDPYRQNPKFKGVGNLLLSGAKEMIDREPTYDIRYYIRYVTLLHAMARDDESYYAKAEPYLRKALELSPTRQELYYLLAFNLVAQGRTDEGIEVARRGVALDNRVARAHFHLALMLDAVGQKDDARRELADVERLNPRLDTLIGTDIRTLGMLYTSLGETDLLLTLVNRSIRGEIPVRLDQEAYTLALKHYADKADKEYFIKVARFVKGTFVDLADDMDVLIDLAEKGNWEIIQKL